MRKALSAIWALVPTIALAGCPAAPVEAGAAPAPAGTVRYERVWVDFPPDGEGWPEIKCEIANTTGKTVAAYHHGMLAYDAAGMPLRIRWNGFSSDEASYYYLCDWNEYEIAPGTTFDCYGGGWNLFSGDPGDREAYGQIAYVLYSLQQVTFSDGTVWHNPDFEGWRSAYEGKPAAVDTLAGYYPQAATG